MTVFVLPCGISILERMERGASPWQAHQDAGEASPRLTRWAAERWAKDDSGTDIATGGRAEADRVGMFNRLNLCGQNPLLVSAERASLVADRPGLPPYGGADEVLFLASDTPEGVLAAHLNAACLARAIEYYPELGVDPVRSEGVARQGRAYIVRIRGLVPTHTDALRQAAADLARALAWGYNLARQGQVPLVIHVAGGYKATIPILVGIAEYLPPPREVWCKHEDSNQAVKIPIRQPPLSKLCNTLIPFSQDGRASDLPPGPDLEGYAYERDQHGWRLTLLGEALRELCLAIRGLQPPVV